MSIEKGKKRIRNIPVLHNELKKKRGVYLTDTAWHSTQELAEKEGLSASEYIEQLIRKNTESG